MRWSPPEQNAHTPSFGDGPLPVSSTQPTSVDMRAWSRAWYSSSTVCGRKALRTSGRSKAMRTVPWASARWYVMSVKSNPSTARHASGSNSSTHRHLTMLHAGGSVPRHGGRRRRGPARDLARRRHRRADRRRVDARRRRRRGRHVEGRVQGGGPRGRARRCRAGDVRRRVGDAVGQGPAGRRAGAARGPPGRAHGRPGADHRDQPRLRVRQQRHRPELERGSRPRRAAARGSRRVGTGDP